LILRGQPAPAPRDRDSGVHLNVVDYPN